MTSLINAIKRMRIRNYEIVQKESGKAPETKQECNMRLAQFVLASMRF